MKNYLNSISKLTLLGIVALTFASCRMDINGIKGSGNVTTQTRNITEPFTGVAASSGMEVIIEQSDIKSVVVEADDNVQNHIVTKVENGILVIRTDMNSFMNVKTMKVTVKMPEINSIEAHGGATLSAANVLKSNAMTIKSNSGSSIEVDIEAEKIISESSGGSEIKLSGKALSYDSSSSSGSSTEAGNLMANEVTAQASSGSSIDVYAIVSLNAKATSGSSVGYKGNPKNITKDEGSGGSVSQN